MLTLVTGQPGAGKSLYAISAVKDQSEKEQRAVYYSGIADLKLPWTELQKGEDWPQVPAGSIVVIDEAQRIFRMRGVGSTVPEHVAALETHRHHGIDIWIVTQHPMLVDTNVRRLVGRHFHVMRAFGMHKATIHEWNEIKEQPDKSRQGSIRHDFLYPKSTFDLYKSAEVHTHKRRLPARLLFLVLAPLLVAGLIWYAVDRLGRYVGADEVPKTAASSMSSPWSPVASSSAGGTVKKTAAEWMSDQQPRIHGLAYTAPVYDEVTQPVHAPYPAACVDWAGNCRCYTQQATRLDMSPSLCRQIVESGFFVAWELDRGKDKGPRFEDRRPALPDPENTLGGGVIADGGVGRGFRPLTAPPAASEPSPNQQVRASTSPGGRGAL